jgi:hypothetical protein
MIWVVKKRQDSFGKGEVPGSSPGTCTTASIDACRAYAGVSSNPEFNPTVGQVYPTSGKVAQITNESEHSEDCHRLGV